VHEHDVDADDDGEAGDDLGRPGGVPRRIHPDDDPARTRCDV